MSNAKVKVPDHVTSYASNGTEYHVVDGVVEVPAKEAAHLIELLGGAKFAHVIEPEAVSQAEAEAGSNALRSEAEAEAANLRSAEEAEAAAREAAAKAAEKTLSLKTKPKR